MASATITVPARIGYAIRWAACRTRFSGVWYSRHRAPEMARGRIAAGVLAVTCGARVSATLASAAARMAARQLPGPHDSRLLLRLVRLSLLLRGQRAGISLAAPHATAAVSPVEVGDRLAQTVLQRHARLPSEHRSAPLRYRAGAVSDRPPAAARRRLSDCVPVMRRICSANSRIVISRGLPRFTG